MIRFCGIFSSSECEKLDYIFEWALDLAWNYKSRHVLMVILKFKKSYFTMIVCMYVCQCYHINYGIKRLFECFQMRIKLTDTYICTQMYTTIGVFFLSQIMIALNNGESLSCFRSCTSENVLHSTCIMTGTAKVQFNAIVQRWIWMHITTDAPIYSQWWRKKRWKVLLCCLFNGNKYVVAIYCW